MRACPVLVSLSLILLSVGCAAPHPLVHVYGGVVLADIDSLREGPLSLSFDEEVGPTFGARAGVLFDTADQLQLGFLADLSYTEYDADAELTVAGFGTAEGDLEVETFSFTPLFMARLFLGGHPGTRRTAIYAGVGPHISELDGDLEGSDIESDDVAVGVDARLGVDVPLGADADYGLSFLAEYRFTHTEYEFEDDDSDTDLDIITNAVLVGVGMEF